MNNQVTYAKLVHVSKLPTNVRDAILYHYEYDCVAVVQLKSLYDLGLVDENVFWYDEPLSNGQILYKGTDSHGDHYYYSEGTNCVLDHFLHLGLDIDNMSDWILKFN